MTMYCTDCGKPATAMFAGEPMCADCLTELYADIRRDKYTDDINDQRAEMRRMEEIQNEH